MQICVTLSVILICLTSNSNCLKCYNCIDKLTAPNKCNSETTKFEDCRENDSDHCVSASFRNVPGALFRCGEKEFCVIKSCSSMEFCKKSGTYRIPLNTGNLTVSCCVGDFCNGEFEFDVNSAQEFGRNCYVFVMVVFCFLLQFVV